MTFKLFYCDEFFNNPNLGINVTLHSGKNSNLLRYFGARIAYFQLTSLTAYLPKWANFSRDTVNNTQHLVSEYLLFSHRIRTKYLMPSRYILTNLRTKT